MHEEHQRDRDGGQQHHEDRKAEQQQRDRHHGEREGHGPASPAGAGGVAAMPHRGATRRRSGSVANPSATVAVRDPHRNAGHVAGASDPQHLAGVEIGLRSPRSRRCTSQQTAARRREARCARGAGRNRTRTSMRRCRLRRVTTAAPRNVIPTMMKICTSSAPKQRDAEQIASDHVGEVEQNRENEGEGQRQFDDACDAVEGIIDHRPSPIRTPRTQLPTRIGQPARISFWGQSLCAAPPRGNAPVIAGRGAPSGWPRPRRSSRAGRG